MTKLSIITVNLNNREGLRKTIESVVGQTWKDFEFIIIDGASTDGSIEIIKEYANYISYWISEPDSGIYNAMNKGITKASGEYCLFLNSGDWLAFPNSLESVISEQIETDIIYFDYYRSHDNKTLDYTKSPNSSQITFKTLFHNSLPHPASLIKRSLFYSVGLYDENFRVVSDWAFFINAIIIQRATISNNPIAISVFNTCGISSSEDSKGLIKVEKELFMEMKFPYFLSDYRQLQLLENVWESRGIKWLYQLNLLYRKLRLSITNCLIKATNH